MIRIRALVLGAALLLVSVDAKARCVHGAAGCGVNYQATGVGARGVDVAPGHHHAGNRDGGVNRVGRRR